MPPHGPRWSEPLPASSQDTLSIVLALPTSEMKYGMRIAPLQAIFEGLKGTWQLRRSLASNLPGFPSGTFEGSATFTPSSAFNGSAYLYHETGTLVTDQGFQLRADRKYIYRYDSGNEKISAWFVKEVDGIDEVDYLYHELEFDQEQDRWVARGDHLCDDDMYWAFYDFRMKGVELTMWGLKHQVKGPDKDYSTDTAYTRVPTS